MEEENPERQVSVQKVESAKPKPKAKPQPQPQPSQPSTVPEPPTVPVPENQRPAQGWQAVPVQQNSGCFSCGDPNHFKRNCPFEASYRWDSHVQGAKGYGKGGFGKGNWKGGDGKGKGGKGSGKGFGKGGRGPSPTAQSASSTQANPPVSSATTPPQDSQ